MIADPVSDFVIRLKNAGAVGKEYTTVPYSNFSFAVAQKLKDAGYIAGVEKKGKKNAPKVLDVTLRYAKDGTHVIHGVKRISKPGRRVYRSVGEIVPVRFGTGALVLSTPKGIVTDKEARKERIGGEALFEIW